MKSRNVLYFLAVSVLSAAPALADKIPPPYIAMEQGGNSISVHELQDGNFLQRARSDRTVGIDASNEATFVSRLNNFDGDDKVSIMDELSSSKLGKTNGKGRSLVLGSRLGHPLGGGGDLDRGKGKSIKLEGSGSPLTVVAVPEPDSFTFVLLGLGALGMLLYRRNSL
jgi:PEP-CTERM motif